MRGIAQSLPSEAPRHHYPGSNCTQRDEPGSGQHTRKRDQQRNDDTIVVPGWGRLNFLPVELGVLFVEERVVHTFALLLQAYPPGRRAHRMNDYRSGHADQGMRGIAVARFARGVFCHVFVL